MTDQGLRTVILPDNWQTVYQSGLYRYRSSDINASRSPKSALPAGPRAGTLDSMHDTSALQVLVLLGLAVLGLTLLAQRTRVPPPIVLLIGGVALAFVPWLSEVTLP